MSKLQPAASRRRRTAGLAAASLLWAASAAGQILPAGTPLTVLPGAETVLDLETAVSVGLEANAVLSAERLRLGELSGQMNQALSTGLPTLDLSGNWSRSRDPSFALDSTFGGGDGGLFGVPDGAPDWFNEWLSGFGSFIPAPDAIAAQSFWRTSLDLNWTINPLKISGAVGAARLGLRRQVLTVRAAEHRTTENVIASYFNIVKSAERIEAVRRRIDNERETLDLMRLRLELGLGTRLDTLQAAVSLANLLPQLGSAEAGLRNEGARLNSLLGRDPQAPLSIRHLQEVEVDAIDDEVALALALEQPDLEASDLLIDILRRNRKAQQADHRPYLTLAGSYGYVGRDLDTLFDNGHDTWRASVALNVPVFDGLLTKGLVGETAAQIRRSEVELGGRRRDAQVEVLGLLANLRLARGVLTAALLNLDRAEEALAESLLMMKLDKIRYLDVLVAEANRAEAQANVIDARYEVITLTASFKRALGVSPLVPLREIPALVVEVSR